jgi:hypothetical protein
MNQTYVPDCWVLVRLESEEFGVVNKILASFYGGYPQGNSWKLSSGIISVEHSDDVYTISLTSGSTYICYENSERLAGMAENVYNDFLRQLEGTESTIKIVSMDDYFKE